MKHCWLRYELKKHPNHILNMAMALPLIVSEKIVEATSIILSQCNEEKAFALEIMEFVSFAGDSVSVFNTKTSRSNSVMETAEKQFQYLKNSNNPENLIGNFEHNLTTIMILSNTLISFELVFF